MDQKATQQSAFYNYWECVVYTNHLSINNYFVFFLFYIEPVLQGFDWTGLVERSLTPPIIPTVHGVADTTNFDQVHTNTSTKKHIYKYKYKKYIQKIKMQIHSPTVQSMDNDKILTLTLNALNTMIHPRHWIFWYLSKVPPSLQYVYSKVSIKIFALSV